MNNVNLFRTENGHIGLTQSYGLFLHMAKKFRLFIRKVAASLHFLGYGKKLFRGWPVLEFEIFL